MKIVIGVGMAGHPVSAIGNTWASLQWVLGFRDLGWDVFMVEGISGAKTIDEGWKSVPFEESANKAHWERVIRQFGLEEQSCLLVDGESKDRQKLIDFARGADLFLNMSGHFKDRTILDLCKHRIYLDGDPAFTQIWSEVYGEDMNFEPHDLFFTVGSLFEKGGVRSPMAGRNWLGIFPAVHLPSWPYQTHSGERYTTMTHWYGYPPVEYQGEWYGNKSEEFERVMDLPRMTSARLEIASDLGDETDLKKFFLAKGWEMTLARDANTDFSTYHRYIQGSRGEFSVAKNGYVRSRSGWFSDRSVCYLASGKPLILQDTGWSEIISSGEGALAFKSLEEAAEGLNRVELNWERHSLAARKLAETHFDSRVVIGEMLRKIEKSL